MLRNIYFLSKIKEFSSSFYYGIISLYLRIYIYARAELADNFRLPFRLFEKVFSSIWNRNIRQNAHERKTAYWCRGMSTSSKVTRFIKLIIFKISTQMYILLTGVIYLCARCNLCAYMKIISISLSIYVY